MRSTACFCAALSFVTSLVFFCFYRATLQPADVGFALSFAWCNLGRRVAALQRKGGRLLVRHHPLGDVHAQEAV